MNMTLKAMVSLTILLGLLSTRSAQAQVVGGVAGYNPLTGRGGRAGAAYNPYTGTGVAGRSTYNPYTGARTQSRTAYNPYTGASATVRRGYNPYTGRAGYSYRYRR